MEDIKIKYFGLELNKKNYLRVYFCYLFLNIALFIVFTICPLKPEAIPFLSPAIPSNFNLLFLANLVYTIVEGQFFWNKFTRKQLETIEKLKEEIEEKNKDLLDSMRYAKRIQTSLLPTDIYISKTLFRLKDSDKKN
jgi:hypothetical protein